MKTPLILIAASGLGREVLEAARAQDRYDVIGFVDDDQAKHGAVVDGVKVLGAVDVVSDYPDVALIVCAGAGGLRDGLVARVAARPERWATVVHPAAAVGSSCVVGEGSVLLAGCVASASVVVGRHVVAMPNVTMTHDDFVDDFATLCAGVALGGSVTIGRRAYVGMGAQVREHLSVGADARIGMGSNVLCSIPATTTWFGNPARPRPTLQINTNATEPKA